MYGQTSAPQAPYAQPQYGQAPTQPQYGQAPYAPQAYSPAPYGQPMDMVSDVQANKGMAIVAYLLFFVPLITGAHKKSPYVKFHTNQGTILFLFNLALNIVLNILGGFLGGIIGLLGLVMLVLVIIGIMNAAQGKMTPLPVIGNLFTIIK